jgi:AcrR family transcriptional regulator
MSAATTRKTADERREAILEAARTEFADHGYEGASTDAIARAAGISQPYLFRLFGTKKDLFIAAEERCFAETLERIRTATEGLTGENALAAIGEAYRTMIAEDPRLLRGQMQAYVACDDAEIREAVCRGFGRIVEFMQSKGGSTSATSECVARGMLFNVLVLIGLFEHDGPWAKQLIAGAWEGS